MSQLTSCEAEFDLAIVGGGIYGAALYWEACHRGLKTLLVEQNDFGAGTSSNSLRTIHGGLRYLQSMDVGRCLMSARERQVLLGIAPNLITPLPCAMPTRRKFNRSWAFLKAGTTAYDILTYPVRAPKRAGHQVKSTRMLSVSEMWRSFPNISLEGITGGALWYDAQVLDSERLTLNYVLSGDSTNNGTSLNHVRAEKVISDSDKVSGLVLNAELSSESLEVSTSMVVDCSGSWNFTEDDSADRSGFGYVKGFNLVFDDQSCSAAIGIEVPSDNERNRLLFVSPWQQKTLVGTWYVPANGGDDAQISDDVIDAALQEIQHLSSNSIFDRDKLVDVHVGQLPANRDQSSVNDLAEVLQAHTSITKHHNGPEGLYRLQGTKYTTAREGAKRMVDNLARRSEKKILRSNSHVEQLRGCRISDIAATSAKLEEEYSKSFSIELINFCLASYGEDAAAILHTAANQEEAADPTIALIGTLLARSLQDEKAVTLSDLLDRRLKNLPRSVLTANLEQVAETLAKLLNLEVGYVSSELKKRIPIFPLKA